MPGDMKDILFLAHRIPYPPDKGDKIRAWNVLRHLVERYRVHLATFIDAPEDIEGVRNLEKICASVVWRPLSPRRAKLRSLAGLLNGAPLTRYYFGDRRLHAAVERLAAAHKPALAYVYSSAMAQYVPDHPPMRVIFDMVDVNSEKWRQYAETSSGLARAIYRREGRTLLALERRAAASAEAVLLVSRAEAQLFARLAPEAADRIHHVGNGVDAAHFDPSLVFANPLGARPAIVFTGVMDYRPNVEAMVWFVAQVMPRLRALAAAPCLWIVGSNPPRRSSRLPERMSGSPAGCRMSGRIYSTRRSSWRRCGLAAAFRTRFWRRWRWACRSSRRRRRARVSTPAATGSC